MVYEIEIFKLFILAAVRISGLMVAAPILGSRNFPIVAKIGLTALTAMLVVPILPEQPGPIPDGAIPFALMGGAELLIGLLMGFTLTIVFAAIQVAGQIMDMLTGFALMNVFNPALEAQVPIFGFFFFVIAVLTLLVLDGHHLMLLGIVNTFDRIPLGGAYMHPALLRDISRLGSIMFYDGLLISAPVAAAMLVAYMSMGLLGRVVPQIQLFAVGFPITIAAGLFLVAMVMGVYITVLEGMFARMFDDVSEIMMRMAA